MNGFTVTDRGLQRPARRSIAVMAPVVFAATFAACATTQRAAQLVVDHHVGMVRGAYDVLTGEAEGREQRRAQLQAELDASLNALATAEDQGQIVDLLRGHVVLQDKLIEELLQQGHGSHHGGHQQAQVEQNEDGTPSAEAHQH